MRQQFRPVSVFPGGNISFELLGLLIAGDLLIVVD